MVVEGGGGRSENAGGRGEFLTWNYLAMHMYTKERSKGGDVVESAGPGLGYCVALSWSVRLADDGATVRG